MADRARDSTSSAPRAGAPDSPAAFSDWLAPHMTRMWHLATRMAPSADADDVVQDAVLAAWRSRASFDPADGSAASWLLSVTANAARKTRLRRWPLPTAVPDQAKPAPDTELAIDVERAVRALPRRQRLAVNCFYFADLTVAETAVVMKCSEGTVKSTLSDARRRLRTVLELS
jgi:RNA polymerase sigma-70 factor (ECF subfamily)